MKKIYSLLLLFLLSIGISAQNITIQINGGNSINDTSLETAITTSGIPLYSITQIDVVGGDFSADDWLYLRTNRNSLYYMTIFNITDNITSVAPVPSATSSSDKTFNKVEEVYIAKLDTVENFLFYNNLNLISVNLPDTQVIKLNSFSACYNLTDVEIPNVDQIDSFAFTKCQSIQSISIPKLTTLDRSAFTNCSMLTEIELGPNPPTISTGSLYFIGTPSIKTIRFVDVNGNPLSGNNLSTAEQNYDNITANGNTANDDLWYGWQTVPSTHTIDITVTDLSNTTFSATGNSLEDAIAQTSVAKNDIETLEINGGDFLVKDWAYLKANRTELSNLKVYNVTNGISFIENSPNLYYSSDSYFNSILENAHIEKINEIGSQTFKDCENLNYVELPDTTIIGNSSFRYCANLDIVIIPKVTVLNNSAFEGCLSLYSISIPKLNVINWYAFKNNSFLTEIELGATPPTVSGNEIFLNNPDLRYITFVDPNGNPLSTTDYAAAELAYDDITANGNAANDDLWYGWTTTPKPAQTITITIQETTGNTSTTTADTLENALAQSGVNTSDITHLTIVGGDFLMSDWRYLKLHTNDLNNLTNFTITNSVSFVQNPPQLPSGESYFNSDTIQTLNISKITDIGNLAFSDLTALQTITFPDISNLSGDGIFSLCDNLQSINFPQLSSIDGESTFGYCSSIVEISLPKLTEINGNFVFRNNSALTKFTAPLLNTIANFTFMNCSNFTRLKLGSTPPNVLGTYAFLNTPTTRYVVPCDANGVQLTGSAWNAAALAYDNVTGNNNTAGDDHWYGWILQQNLGTTEIESKETISVYPNPATDVVYVDSNNVELITLYDMQGRRIATSTSNRINVTNLTKGIYLIQVKLNDGQTITKKVMKR